MSAAALNRVARQYGAEIIDVRIKQADLPDGTPLAVGLRPDAHRARSRKRARSAPQGAKQAQIIRAEADAEAAKTYAASFGKDRGILRFLPGDAVLPDDLHRRRRTNGPRQRPSFCRRRTTI